MMKIRNRSLVFLLLTVLLVFSMAMVSYAQNEITIKLDNRKIPFPDAKPYMDAEAGRVLVPVRFVSESLGAEVQWDDMNKAVTIIKDKAKIRIKLGERNFTVNGVKESMDTAAFLKDGRTYVPIRFISENLGVDTSWDQKSYTVLLNTRSTNLTKEFMIQGIYVGISEAELISKLGEPSRKDLSKYGFEWYIYNKDYSKYIQVGVKDKKVVGLYTNSDNWKSAKGIEIGMKRSEVEKLLGESLKSIKKGNRIYLMNNLNEKGLYFVDGTYVSIYYDIHENNTVTSLQIIDENIELGLGDFYGTYSERLRDGFEKQVFDIANATRVRKGLEPFIWSDKARISSRKHSQDMADYNYFDHTNLKGESPFHRMEREGILYISAAENIAAGVSDAIEAHEGWMNSMGHRKNILGDFKTLGVGVAYNPNSTYKYYYTQNFFTGR